MDGTSGAKLRADGRDQWDLSVYHKGQTVLSLNLAR